MLTSWPTFTTTHVCVRLDTSPANPSGLLFIFSFLVCRATPLKPPRHPSAPPLMVLRRSLGQVLSELETTSARGSQPPVCTTSCFARTAGALTCAVAPPVVTHTQRFRLVLREKTKNKTPPHYPPKKRPGDVVLHAAVPSKIKKWLSHFRPKLQTFEPLKICVHGRCSDAHSQSRGVVYLPAPQHAESQRGPWGVALHKVYTKPSLLGEKK